MDVLLNEVTYTIHRRKKSTTGFQAKCGIHHHLAHDKLQITTVEQSTTEASVNKCGRCFDDAGGY